MLSNIIDVGARDTTYPEEHPNAICHLFEPSIKHFKILEERFKDNLNVVLNNYGLGDKIEMLGYDPYRESCVFGTMRDYEVPISTLDLYIKEQNIKHIDFLKIDTEGMDLKVLLGGIETIKITDNIQYEHSEELDKSLLEEFITSQGFTVEYIGDRNVLCKKKSPLQN